MYTCITMMYQVILVPLSPILKRHHTWCWIKTARTSIWAIPKSGTKLQIHVHGNRQALNVSKSFKWEANNILKQYLAENILLHFVLSKLSLCYMLEPRRILCRYLDYFKRPWFLRHIIARFEFWVKCKRIQCIFIEIIHPWLQQRPLASEQLLKMLFSALPQTCYNSVFQSRQCLLCKTLLYNILGIPRHDFFYFNCKNLPTLVENTKLCLETQKLLKNWIAKSLQTILAFFMKNIRQVDFLKLPNEWKCLDIALEHPL